VAFVLQESLVRSRHSAPVLAGELKEFLGKLSRFGLEDRLTPLLQRPDVLARFPG
jgi:hypothetical protein